MIIDHDYIHNGQEDGTEQREQSSQATQQVPSAEENNYKENFLRLSADFSNYKRRMEKERDDWFRMAQGSVIEKILPYLSDFERAFESAEKSTASDISAWLEGFRLIEKNLKKSLTDLGVQEIISTGDFNPEYHEALMRVPGTNYPSGTIVQTFNKGYLFKGKVIKHAQVSVAE